MNEPDQGHSRPVSGPAGSHQSAQPHEPQLPELREPDLPRTAKVRPRALRTGWTTGTCASAAAKAAVTALRDQAPQHRVEIPLPSGRRVAFPVESCTYSAQQGTAVVVKDAGDDPDVTHGAQLTATVRWRESVQTMLDLGVVSFVEVGAGKVLSGLVRRIAPDAAAVSAGTPGEIESLLKTL